MERRMLLAVLACLAIPSRARCDDYASLSRDTRSFLKGLIRLDTSNPPGNEILAATYLKMELDKEGISAQIYTSSETRASLIARLEGSGAKKPLLLMCHTDVVPADRKEWSADPFEPVEKDGFLYGRGALDIKSMCAAELAVLLSLKRSGERLDRDVVFFAEADEEAGDSHHLEWLLKEHGQALDAEFGINEGGAAIWKDGRLREVRVQTAEKQYMDVQLAARGQSGHASVPLPDNALAALSRAVARAAAYRPKARLEPSVRRFFERQLAFEPADVRKALRDVLDAAPQAKLTLASARQSAAQDPSGEALRDAPAAALPNPRLDRAVDKLEALKPEYGAMLRDTINPTMLQAGYKSNVVPAEATAVLNARLMPSREPRDFIRELAAVLADPSIRIRFTPPAYRPVGAMPLDTELYRAVESAVSASFPKARVVPYMAVWSTDSLALRARGTIMYGIDPPQAAGDDDREHGTDERIPLAALDAYSRYLYDIVLKTARAR